MPTKKLTLRDLRSPQLVKLARIAPDDLVKLLTEIDAETISIEELADALTAIITASAMTSGDAAVRLALAAAWPRVAKLNEPMPVKRREQLALARQIAPLAFGLPAKTKTKPTTKKG